MHRPWNPKSFFRKISPDVMAAYEAAFGIGLQRDEARPKHERTYFAWKALPDGVRHKLEARLLLVNDLCSEPARPYLLRLAGQVWTGDNAHLIEESREWSINDLAMRLFITDADELVRCHRHYAVDMMDHFREYRGKHPIQLQATPEAKAKMKEEMKEHFRERAGGARCAVEDFEAEDKFALTIVHQDEMTPVDNIDEHDNVTAEWQRPVVRIAAVFYPETCTLLVKAPRKPDRERLRDLFAKIFVGETDYFEDVSKTPRWNFTPLATDDFDFTTSLTDRIANVRLARLTMRSDHRDLKQHTIEMKRDRTLVDIKDALRDHSLEFNPDLVDGIHLEFEFDDDTKGRARFRTVSLFRPNSTNLCDIKRDRVIRRLLREWKIDASQSTFSLSPPPLAAAAHA